jgi:uncharacterized protein (TIGR01777 family)
MNILVSGSTGFIGSSVVKLLTEEGHRVVRLVRSQPKSDEIYWDPAAGKVDTFGLEGMDSIVHLAGESIVGRWTTEKKKKIFESRVRGTTLLCDALARLTKKPKAIICASAIGYYGDRGEELLTEESASGKGFLAEVCRAWEAATEPAKKSGIRVVHLRFGMVLSSKGGALKKMLLPFKIGIGGKLGIGNQYMSWISLQDIGGIILYALLTDILRGPVNAVAPNPVRNIEFTKTLGRVLKRPVLFPMPAVAARLIFGQIADELLLASTRVKPARLLAENYSFRHSNLEEALREII